MIVKEQQRTCYSVPNTSVVRLTIKAQILSYSQERDIDDGTDGEEDGD